MESKITTKSPQKKEIKNRKINIDLQQDYQQAKANLERQKNYDRIARIALIVFFIFTIIAFFVSLETK
jgi:t-SNARE complex subunit (syntaxin)